eukprot:CAMPEP_0203760314 /NCGR_PEP_ID=MMETSP0098-20131031/13636_1 /ASSEMBLY_ACC=CAM_ASM_000208 /TAXON_ID=96639 /ORGANISM=" , Strain NY0313808BC1" /LENGTH=916 /DNA_ID=CAMNT_0050653825 /DNA_START=378 /DNA_END=3124 /DNA_ORIENTATION=-
MARGNFISAFLSDIKKKETEIISMQQEQACGVIDATRKQLEQSLSVIRGETKNDSQEQPPPLPPKKFGTASFSSRRLSTFTEHANKENAPASQNQHQDSEDKTQRKRKSDEGVTELKRLSNQSDRGKKSCNGDRSTNPPALEPIVFVSAEDLYDENFQGNTMKELQSKLRKYKVPFKKSQKKKYYCELVCKEEAREQNEKLGEERMKLLEQQQAAEAQIEKQQATTATLLDEQQIAESQMEVDTEPSTPMKSNSVRAPVEEPNLANQMEEDAQEQQASPTNQLSGFKGKLEQTQASPSPAPQVILVEQDVGIEQTKTAQSDTEAAQQITETAIMETESVAPQPSTGASIRTPDVKTSTVPPTPEAQTFRAPLPTPEAKSPLPLAPEAKPSTETPPTTGTKVSTALPPTPEVKKLPEVPPSPPGQRIEDVNSSPLRTVPAPVPVKQASLTPAQIQEQERVSRLRKEKLQREERERLLREEKLTLQQEDEEKKKSPPMGSKTLQEDEKQNEEMDDRTNFLLAEKEQRMSRMNSFADRAATSATPDYIKLEAESMRAIAKEKARAKFADPNSSHSVLAKKQPIDYGSQSSSNMSKPSDQHTSVMTKPSLTENNLRQTPKLATKKLPVAEKKIVATSSTLSKPAGNILRGNTFIPPKAAPVVGAKTKSRTAPVASIQRAMLKKEADEKLEKQRQEKRQRMLDAKQRKLQEKANLYPSASHKTKMLGGKTNHTKVNPAMKTSIVSSVHKNLKPAQGPMSNVVKPSSPRTQPKTAVVASMGKQVTPPTVSSKDEQATSSAVESNEWREEDNYAISDQEDNDGYKSSDDEDEEYYSNKPVPEWARKENLNEVLREQCSKDSKNRIDPDSIFVDIPVCDLQAIFAPSARRASSKKRYQRNRGSSQHWERDGLTIKEKKQYRKDL